MAISAAQLNVRIQTEGAAAAKRDINDVGDAVDNSAAKSRMLGAGFLAMGTAIAGGFGYGVTQAISFGEQMANVNSIAQLSTAELAALSDEVIALGSASGQSPQVLAAGLYDIASSGFAGADGMKVLEASSRAATAGMTTTDVAARGVTAALNAYNLGADDAAHVSDVMFQTVNEGVITFEQLSANMGNTLPLANALGISFEELGAGYAVMTKNGVGASQTETQIAALMRSAINPTTELTAAVQAYGYESVESLIATEGLTGYLALLTEASGGTSEELFKLTGTAEATNAALLLGGENADEYAASVERMKASSEGLGATQTALAKQMESTAFSLRLLKTNVQAAAIAIGVQLEPGIRVVAKAMTGLLKGFLNLSKPVQKVIGVITALGGVLALAAGAWILFGSQITMAAGLFLSLLGPIALIVAAVAGLYYAWTENLFGIQDITRNAMDAVMGFLEPVTDFLGDLKDAWDGAAPSSDVMSKISAWGGLSDGTTKSVMDQVSAWGGLTEEMSIAERAMNALDVASGGLVTRIREMSALDFAIAIGDIAVSIGGWVIDGLAGLWDEIARKITGTPQGEPVSISDVIISVGRWVMAAGANLYDEVRPWIDAALSAVSGIVQQIPEVALTVGTWVMRAGANLYDVVEPWIEAAVGAASGIVHNIPEVAVSVGAWAMRTGANLYDVVQPWIESAVGAVSGIIHSVPEVALEIADWSVTAAIELGTRVQEYVQGMIGGVGSGGSMQSAPGGMRAVGGGIPIPAIALSIADWVVDSAADLGAAILIWVAGKVGAIDFTGVGLTLKSKFFAAMGTAFAIGGDIGSALGGVIDLGASILDWATQQIEGVDWNAAGATFARLLIAGIKGAVVGTVAIGGLAGSLLGGILNSLADVNWSAVGTSFKDFFIAAIKAVGSFFVGFGTTLGSELGTEVGKIPWSGIGTAIKNGFVEAVSGVGQAIADKIIGELPDELLSLLGLGGDSATPQGQPGGGRPGSGGGNHFRSLTPESMPNLVQQVQLAVDNSDALAKIKAVKDAIAGLGGVGGSAASGAVAGLAAAAAAITVDTSGAMTALSSLSLAMNTAIVAVATGMTTIQAVVQNAMNGIIVAVASITTAQAVIQASVNGMIVAVATGFTTMQTVVQAAVNGMIVAVATSMTTMRAVVAAQMAGVTAAIVSGMATARAATVAGAAAMSASMIAGMAAFRNAVTSGMAAAVGAVRSGVAQMVAAASAGRGAMASAGQGIGAALGQGIAAGIRGQIGAVAAAAASLVQTAVAAARSAGAIRSPSKVMHDQIGLMLGLGVERGILDSIAGINRAAGLMVPTLSSSTGSGSLAGTGSSGSNAPTYNVYVTVEGNVTSERTLTATITREIANGIRSDLIRHRTASGVAQ